MINLSSPWIIFYKEVEELFRHDPDVTTEFDDETRTITIRVEDNAKADALTKILPDKKIFGNVEVKINVVPANKEETIIDTFKTAFRDNGIFAGAIEKDTLLGNFKYLCFVPRVVQFYADDISNPHGNKSMLISDLVKDIFGEIEGVTVCVDYVNDHIRVL